MCVLVTNAAGDLPASAACNGCVEAALGRCPDLCDGGTGPGSACARYTAAQLRSALLLMGCKPRVAHKVRRRASCLFQVTLCCTTGYTQGWLRRRRPRACSRRSRRACARARTRHASLRPPPAQRGLALAQWLAGQPVKDGRERAGRATEQWRREGVGVGAWAWARARPGPARRLARRPLRSALSRAEQVRQAAGRQELARASEGLRMRAGPGLTRRLARQLHQRQLCTAARVSRAAGQWVPGSAGAPGRARRGRARCG